MNFSELGLIQPLVRAVAEKGYARPTPIQQQAIPQALAGKDIVACAQTGTGKTGAFALPILQRLSRATAGKVPGASKNKPGRKPRALILCPTRELAIQISESLTAYGIGIKLKHTAVFGGVSQNGQVRGLNAGTDILVATPGRLIDLVDQGRVDLSNIECFVLDEADRMLDMGFIRDIRRIVNLLPDRRQTLLFSATMPPEMRRLVKTMLQNPVSVMTDSVSSPAKSISQSVYMVARHNKRTLLEKLLLEKDMNRALVFTSTKHRADRLVKVLQRVGLAACAIHGNKSQNARNRALNGFKSGEVPILVATDVASRGIDVDEVSHVINFDVPNVPETYVHRIGRTARAGASGIAMSFCDADELQYLRAIEQLIDEKIVVAQEGFGLTMDAPTVRLSGQRRRSKSTQPTSLPRKGRSRSRNKRGSVHLRAHT